MMGFLFDLSAPEAVAVWVAATLLGAAAWCGAVMVEERLARRRVARRERRRDLDRERVGL
jgi:hypothetical protein